jgi:glycosyltransferase involved in cell wall biosynthesis
LERYKGHQRVIAAMPYLLTQRPNARLWVLGTGPYEPELRQQVQELGLTTRVRIEGIPPERRNQMARELSCAALVVLLSDFETHPIGILEALSLKRPVLVAETSGLQELVEHGYARGVALDSTPEQVAAGMLEQMTMPSASKEIQLPTWDDCTSSLLDLYRSVLRRYECAF